MSVGPCAEVSDEERCQQLTTWLGRAVQVDHAKYTLKLTGTKRLKLKSEILLSTSDMLLSTSALKFNLRLYSLENTTKIRRKASPGSGNGWRKTILLLSR